MNKKELVKDRLFVSMLLIAIFEIVGFIIALTKNGFKIMGFYTQESNLVVLIVALVFVIYKMMSGNKKTPRWLLRLIYVGTCMVAVTFVTVVLVLIPMYAPYGIGTVIWLLAGGSNLFHHLLSPLLAIFVFIAWEKEFTPALCDELLAACPTLLYAIVSTSLNVFKIVRGPYPFLYVYEQPVWVSVMWFLLIPSCGFLFAWIIGKIKRSKMKKENC